MFRKILLAAAVAVSCMPVGAQPLEFGKNSYDFGQIKMSDGPVSCSFSAVNRTDHNVSIMSVTTSCGCTNAKWDHNPIAPGATTRIDVTYSNEEGPRPFDKTVTVSFLNDSRPAILHVRGISVKDIKPDSEVYVFVYGGKLGLTGEEFKCGNIEQGNSRSDETTVANLSDEPLKVSFSSVTEGLALAVTPNPIPAKSHASLKYTVKSSTDKWGTNRYSANFVLNGAVETKKITVKALTAENFSSCTKEERARGSRPIFRESTFSFGHQKQGNIVTATFTCENKGAKILSIHKMESEYRGVKFGTLADIDPGKSGSFSLSLDTKNLPRGEALVMVTLITNSPMRPIVNLCLAGWID